MEETIDNDQKSRYNRATSHEPRATHNYTQNSPVRIAHIVGRTRNGGVEAMLFGYYKYIDRKKFVYDFLIDEDSPHVPYNEINSLGGNLIFVPPYSHQPAYQKALYKLFTEKKYPIVYSHLNTLSVFPLFAAWRAGIPIRVAHNHSTAGKGRGEFKRNVMKYTLRPLAKIFPTHLCACSEYAGRWLFGNKAMDSGRVKVWPNGIELERYAYNEDIRRDMRQYLKLSDKFVVGHSGRFEAQKNHDFLADVFAQIRRRRSDAVLLLVGDGPLMDKIREKAARLGLNDCVVFTGNVYDAERYYQAMDMFIFPSLYEGLGMSAVEAELSGLPVIASDKLPDEAKICDNLRFMSLKRSARDWADEALKLADGHIRRDMSDYAREAGFDIKIQGARLSEWYCELLGIKS